MVAHLVVGGAGFIGSHLVLRLLRDGHEVRVVDNFTTGRMENLADAREHVDIRRGDMRDQEVLDVAMRGIDSVFLQAAIPSVARSIQDPKGTHEVNVGGTLSVLLAARDAGVRRLIFASSAAVYGTGPEMPKTESLMPRPASPYGVAKLMGEHYCRVFRELDRLPTVSLRYFNVFGPHQNLRSDYASAVPRFIQVIGQGSTPEIFGTGQQSRDFVYVDNVVEANILACAGDDPGPGPFNVGSGQSTTILELIAIINHIFDRDVRPQFLPARPGDIPRSQADISRARAALGYEATVPIDIGLHRMAGWAQENWLPRERDTRR